MTLVLGVLAALFAYRESFRGRIYPGVQVAGVSVGSMTPTEAESALRSHLAVSAQAPLVLQAAGRRWELARETFGAHYDVEALAAGALAVGRHDGPVQNLLTPLVLRLHPRDLGATITLRSTDWAVALDPIARAVDRPAVNARLRVNPDHSVQVVPEQAGVQLDQVASRDLITAALISGRTAPIDLPVKTIAPAITAADLAPTQQRLQALLAGPITVSFGGQSWTLGLDDVQAALILPETPGASVDVDPALIRDFVARIAAAVDRPSRDARLRVQGDQVVLDPAQSSRTVDQAETAKRIQAALFDRNRSVAPVVREAPASVGDADLQPALKLANQMIGKPVTLAGPDGQTWTMSSATLVKLLALPAEPTNQRTQSPQLDPARLQAYVDSLASQIDRPAFNARFQYAGGQVRLIRDAIPGRRLDRGATIAAITQAVQGNDRMVALPVATVPAAITADYASRLVGLQLIGENTTSYAGSIPPRKHNVELAASLLNGVVVAPGEIFSFNRELGPQTLDRGFQVGFGIVAQGNGQVKTVPSVGGGICQVSTTLFQPVFWAGYEIEERHWHAYWIAHYASHGYPGLDDTVDDASGLDFQFKNNTPYPLLIQSSTDGTHVHFALYGTPPDWTVHVDPPVITNVIKTDRTLQVQPDPTMPRGTQIYTEAAEDGFTVQVHRVVTDSSGHVRELTLRSVYAPSHNVVLVGTKPPASG